MDAFDRLSSSKGLGIVNKPKGDAFDQFAEKKEGFWKNAARTALQIPQGIAEATTYGITTGLQALLGAGEVYDPEEIERIRKISEREGIPFDEEAYLKAAQSALETVPTVSNISSAIEEKTGIPLEPKTGLQKAFRLGSMAGKFQPGAASQKAVASVAAPTVSAGLKAAGVPEPFADIAGLGVGGVAGAKTPAAEITKQKPSGLTERQFESITKPREVSAKKMGQIKKQVEEDFRKHANKIIEESPIGETAQNLHNDPTFKQASRDLIEEAQTIANSSPGTLDSKFLKKEYGDLAKKQIKGFALGEYDKSYMKFMKESIEGIVPERISMGELVEQYRKNNKSLGEYFEPGASKALNRAKRDALLDSNRAIANVLEKQEPALSAVFKEGNQRWSKIMDTEAVDEFVNKMFEGKLNYKKMHDFFDKSGYDFIFKRALGEEGYKDFTQLMKDMLTSERSYKMLNVAADKGYNDLAKMAMGYILHPKIGYAKAALDFAKYGWRSLINSMLDKPKLGLTFKKGVESLKKGDFKTAEKEFKTLQGEIEVEPKAAAAKPEGTIVEITPEEIAKETKQLAAPQKRIEHKEPKAKETPVTEVKKEPKQPKPKKETKEKAPVSESSKNELPISKKTPESEWVYTREDFPTLKEAREYLDHLNRSYEKAPETHKPTLMRDIGNLEEIVQGYVDELPTKAEAAKKNVAKKRAARKEAQTKTHQEAKIEAASKNDISKKGLKEQKEYLLNEIDKAIKNAPEGHPEFGKKLGKSQSFKEYEKQLKERSEGYELLTFHVPGDGTFKIKNNKKALEAFYNRVEKKWPKSVR